MWNSPEKTSAQWKADPFGVYDINLDVVTTPEATVAVLSGIINGEAYTWNGVSKRFPGDRYIPAIGIKIAVGRAFARAAKQMLKQGNGLVKNMDDNRERQAEQAKAQKASPRYHRVSRRRERSSSAV